MITNYYNILDNLLTSVPVDQIDEAEQFVREVKFMCNEYMSDCPIPLLKQMPTVKQPGTFFTAKNRHRAGSTAGNLLNQALTGVNVFERGLDVHIQPIGEDCIVFLPDRFSVHFSDTNLEYFAEAAKLVNVEDLGHLVYHSNISTLTESAQHILVSNVPFYYCVRVSALKSPYK